MNLKEELVLEILSNANVVKGKTKFVKMLHFTCKLFEKNKKESPFRFRDDNYGVYSPELEPVLQNLENNGYIKMQKSFFSKRIDLAYLHKPYEISNPNILELKLKIKALIQILNEYSADDVIAFSYHLFPDTTQNSKIKPKVNKKIVELFTPLSTQFEESIEEKETEEALIKEIKTEGTTLSPQFNDLDIRMHMMKSLNLKELPPIIPDMIDESTGLLSKKHPFF